MECFIKCTPIIKRELTWRDFICPPEIDKYIVYLDKDNIYGTNELPENIIDCGEDVELFIKTINYES